MTTTTIEYTSEKGLTGTLYNWHQGFDGGWAYEMSVRNRGGVELLHAYNAAPKNLEELKKVVEWVERSNQA